MTRHQASRPPATDPRTGLRWRHWLLGVGLLGSLGAQAQTPPPPEPAATTPTPTKAPAPSALDAPMFYQLMVAEMEAQAGRLGNAFEITLDAARRLHDESLYQRATELAVQARGGEQALVAARAWRQAHPRSVEAARTEVQVLAALDRPQELGEPLRHLLALSDPNQRTAMIAGLPRFLEAATDKARTLATAEQALGPYLNAADTRTAARVALGRVALAAGQSDRALSLARQALADEPAALGPVVLAVELMPTQPAAETLVQAGLTQTAVPPSLRMGYARLLEQRQRLVEAAEQMRLALAQQPDLPQGWLSYGALMVEMHRAAEAEPALRRALAELPADDTRSAALADLCWQLLSQTAEQRGDAPAAAEALSRIPAERATLAVRGRQAALAARAGQWPEARRLLRDAPAADGPTPRDRLLAEVQLLRGERRWQEAHALLSAALAAAPDDAGLVYEQAMLVERLGRLDEMEALLRRVIAARPDDAQAYNALGYSLAERGLRLDEASTLIRRALTLAAGDPYIVDSLGWLEFRMGRLEEAERLLRRAWGSRPHPEVAAHLGEVLWTQGRRDEAVAIWREGLQSGSDTDSLLETLRRLKAPLP
jgi:tetratricopeptide (TPR) repeat protein